MKKIRSFIAIPLPSPLQTKLGELETTLKHQMQEGITWVHPDLLHITMKFLGDIDDILVPDILEVMRNTAVQYKPFEIIIQKLGTFPEHRSPNIVWVGLDEPIPTVQRLGRNLDESLSKLGISREDKEFHAHITIARIKQRQPKCNWPQLVAEYQNTVWGRVNVKSFILFQSTLLPKGPIYTPLGEVALGQ